ncbi:uncharacterized protein [Nicotiana sylvestris]|uniref:uncharacterized protein n=1 Tax=Nicotiana sylvestris TaxID=4096 RepID=UPI00388C3DD9
MHDFIMAKDCDPRDIICDCPYVPIKVLDEFSFSMAKTSKEHTEADRKVVEKNFRAKKILVCGMGPKEYNRISTCDTAKEIWEALQTAHEGTTQVKQSEDKPNTGDNSMMAVEGDEIGYDLTFSLMAQSDDDEDNGNKEDRDSLILELGESEHTRDDLVAAVTNHKKTIEILRKEKSDLLAEIANQRETIVKPWTKSKPENAEKTKEIASEEHIRLENEVKALRFRMCDKIEKNELLQTNLERGVGFQREKTPHNPHSKYVTVSDNWPRTQCGNTGRFKEGVQTKNQSVQKDKVVAETVTTKEGPGSTHKKRTLPAWTKRTLIHPLAYYKGPKLIWVPKTNSQSLVQGIVKGSGQQWFMDNRCLKHMTGKTTYFLSLKALQGGSVSFGNGNKVEFLSKICTVTDLVTGEIVLVAKRYKNIYVANFKSLMSGDLSCLHMDLCGPMRVQSRGGKICIFVIVDDYSRFTWTLFLRTKDETVEVFVAFVKKIQIFWAEAVNTYCYLVNRCMIISLLNKTPYELLNGRKPKLTHLGTFGCKCYVLNKGKDQLGKFDAKSDEGIFLGYSSQSKAYKIYNKRTQCVEESVHADMMSQVKEPNEDNDASSSTEPSTSITTTEAEERVVDAV